LAETTLPAGLLTDLPPLLTTKNKTFPGRSSSSSSFPLSTTPPTSSIFPQDSPRGEEGKLAYNVSLPPAASLAQCFSAPILPVLPPRTATDVPALELVSPKKKKQQQQKKKKKKKKKKKESDEEEDSTEERGHHCLRVPSIPRKADPETESPRSADSISRLFCCAASSLVLIANHRHPGLLTKFPPESLSHSTTFNTELAPLERLEFGSLLL
jgi:hypothetical protein